MCMIGMVIAEELRCVCVCVHACENIQSIKSVYERVCRAVCTRRWTHTHTQNSTDVAALQCEYLTSLNPSVQLFMRQDTESLVNINTAASLPLSPHLCTSDRLTRSSSLSSSVCLSFFFLFCLLSFFPPLSLSLSLPLCCGCEYFRWRSGF